MTAVESSPFVFSGPAPPDDVVGRDDVIAALANRALAGRFTLLTAPRRYGKTSLVRRLQRDAHRRKELVVVVVDLLGIATTGDLAGRMAQAWTRLPAGPVEKAVRRVSRYLPQLTAAAGPVSATVHLRSAGAEADGRTLEAVLDVPYRVAEQLDRRVLVVLDEFQAVADVPRADAVIRSQIQHQTDRVAYLFCGSEQSTLHLLFDDRAAPLYGQAEPFTLRPLPPEAAGRFIDRRFAATGRGVDGVAMGELLLVAGGHPQRTMLLAHHLWEQTPPGTTADVEALEAAVGLALDRTTDEFHGVLSSLSATQRKVVRLAAWHEPWFGRAAARLKLPKSSAQSAVPALRDAGIIDADGRLVDPLLSEWIRRRDPRP